MKKKNSIFTVVFYAVLAIVILFAVAALFMGNGGEEEIITDKDILGYLFMTFFSACLAIAMINEEASIGFILFACAAAFVQAGKKWRKVCGNDRGRDPLYGRAP